MATMHRARVVAIGEEKDMLRLCRVMLRNCGEEEPDEERPPLKLEELLAQIQRRAQEEGLTLRTTRRLRAHTCTALRPPHRRPGGCMFAAKPDDLDVAAAFVLAMHRDTREGDQTPEGCRAIAQQRIENTRLFLWKDEQGAPCAMCGVSPDGESMGLSLVYTPLEKRRQGYAASLVHDVTHAILAQHRLPVIYTDADYPPSNACYAQIGYMRCGTLETLAWGEQA